MEQAFTIFPRDDFAKIEFGDCLLLRNDTRKKPYDLGVGNIQHFLNFLDFLDFWTNE